jgi:hypothetical protein
MVKTFFGSISNSCPKIALILSASERKSDAVIASVLSPMFLRYAATVILCHAETHEQPEVLPGRDTFLIKCDRRNLVADLG